MDNLHRSRESSLQLRDFLNDVYIYLSNEVPNHMRRKTLMSDCVRFLGMDFQPKNGESHEWPSGSTMPTPTVPNPNKCPYRELSADHLSLRRTTHIGWLTQTRRFCTVKRYYAAVLDGWLLMYSGGETANRPMLCYALSSCSWLDSQVSNDEFRLTLITATKKRHFQINCHQDLLEWVNALNESKPSPPPSPITDSHIAKTRSIHSYTMSQHVNLHNNALAPPYPMVEIYNDPVHIRTAPYPQQQIGKSVTVGAYDIPSPNPRPVNRQEQMRKSVSVGGYDIPSPNPRRVTRSLETLNSSTSFEDIKSRVAALLHSPTNVNQFKK